MQKRMAAKMFFLVNEVLTTRVWTHGFLLTCRRASRFQHHFGPRRVAREPLRAHEKAKVAPRENPRSWIETERDQDIVLGKSLLGESRGNGEESKGNSGTARRER